MADTEKITINISAVDLGRIDLLADDGFYSSRTDFIRTAIRKELDVHGEEVKQGVSRRASVLGAMVYTRSMLEQCVKRGQKLEIAVVGAVYLADDVTPELALKTIKRLKVFGVLRASQAVKDALADRTH
jgi:Arc/MetJ-type ribon-helix-helix transcriptional regulator